MKKILFAILAVMLMASEAWAAGSCTNTLDHYSASVVSIKLVCTGDSANGSIPTQTLTTAQMDLINGTHYLYQVKAYPTTGGTAPDAADVAVLMSGMDLLGAKGVNLIHASALKIIK